MGKHKFVLLRARGDVERIPVLCLFYKLLFFALIMFIIINCFTKVQELYETDRILLFFSVQVIFVIVLG